MRYTAEGWNRAEAAMRNIVLVVTALLLLPAPAHAATYPIAGKWAYDTSSGAGPIPCAHHAMIEFAGSRRFETGGKAPPDYRLVSVERKVDDTYRIVDRFFNGMQNGKVAYTLRRIDPDRIEIKHEI